MKTPNVILIFLLVLSSIALAAEVKPPAVLLQEGLYAEETEGNLDRAMEIYSQIKEKYNDVERIAARAAYQLGLCNLKKGDNKKAAELFQEVVSYYPQQTEAVKMAQQQLDKMGIKKADEGNFFEILGQVSAYIGSKYGEISAEAGTKKLYSNSHIYLVGNDFVLRTGGMGYIYNWTTEPITKHYRLSNTSNPNQKLYDVVGILMDTEILPDANRSGFYNIYWNPKEPIQPGGYFYYGWAMDGSKPLPKTGQGYQLKMNNYPGDHCYETFFLVVPEGTVITSQSEDYTNKGNLNGWDIYWWKKEVPENNYHTVNVVLKKAGDIEKELPEELTKFITDKHIEASNTANEKNLKVNSQIYQIDVYFHKSQGGLMMFQNQTNQPITGEIYLGKFSKNAQTDLTDEKGLLQKIRFVDGGESIGRYSLMWTPDKAIEPNKTKMLKYMYSTTDILPKANNGYALKMKNFYGSAVLENFFLILPAKLIIIEQSEQYVFSKDFGDFKVFLWQKEVPHNTENIVDVVLNEKSN